MISTVGTFTLTRIDQLMRWGLSTILTLKHSVSKCSCISLLSLKLGNWIIQFPVTCDWTVGQNYTVSPSRPTELAIKFISFHRAAKSWVPCYELCLELCSTYRLYWWNVILCSSTNVTIMMRVRCTVHVMSNTRSQRNGTRWPGS